MSKIDYNNSGFGTLAIHAGQEPDPLYGALATPIYQTSTFCFESLADMKQKAMSGNPMYVYTRGGNPTTSALEKKIAVLEGGEACLATASGMGAIGSALTGLLKAGDHVVSGACVYGCTATLLKDILTRFGIEVSFVDTCDLAEVEGAIKENTKIIYFETPTNPSMQVTDIEAISKLAHAKGIKVVVDNTFAPPPVQFPIKAGADIVVHSGTKYLNGHGDVICGFIIGNKEDINAIKVMLTKLCGATPSPFSSYLVMRGLQTLKLRMKQHCENALAVAKYLENHPYVKKVYYPGLESHPQYELSKKQMNGGSCGIMSFELKDGINGMDTMTASVKLLDSLQLASIAVSLGDPETLIQHPASMTHKTMTKEEREKAGIPDGLIRLSVGLEDIEDIIGDFEQAFAKM